MMRLLPPWILGLILAVVMSGPADAMVYALQKGYSLRDVRALIKAKSVLKDKVTINGVEGDLEAFLSPMKLSDALEALKPALKEHKATLGNGTAVIDVTDGKWINRLMLLKAGSKSQVVIFQMRLPAGANAKNPENAWPSTAPKPSGVRVDRVIKLKKSGAAFCQFSRGGTSSFVEGYRDALLGDGWKSVTNEKGAGGTFLSEKKDKMLIFSVWKTDDKSYGSIFVRKISKLPLK